MLNDFGMVKILFECLFTISELSIVPYFAKSDTNIIYYYWAIRDLRQFWKFSFTNIFMSGAMT